MSGLRFAHDTLAQRVVFGTGTAAADLAAEVERLGGARVVVIASDHDTGLVARLTAGLPVVERVVHDSRHVPASLADEARAAALAAHADVLVSIGGGSTTGIAKAIALDTALPIVAVPTTYAGSEATPVWGRTDDGVKTTGTDARVLPRAVVYDAALTLSLPVALSVASGLNALAHCVDALWAPRADPLTTAYAEMGIRAIRAALPAIVADPADAEGREQMLVATYYSALAFAGAGSGMHHKICHVLGGRFDLPHADTHAIVLPHVVAFNAPAAPAAAAVIARALGASTETPEAAVRALWEFGAAVGAPRSLGALGVADADLDAAAELCAAAVPASNPRPVDAAAVRALLADAVAGRAPRGVAEREGSRVDIPALARRLADGVDTTGVEPAQVARERAIVDEVIASFAATRSPRTRELLQALTAYLHAFVRDVRLTEKEWEGAIAFLTAAGHITTETRQEFILLSDVLGASMQTICVNNAVHADATEATVFGPFFVDAAPVIALGEDISGDAQGQPCWVEGTVRDVDGNPVAGAVIDVWECDEDGFYDVQYDDGRRAARARMTSDAAGAYRFWALTPVPYPIPDDGPVGGLLAASGRSPMRASHLHFMVAAPGLRTLVTHIFVEGDEYLERDSVFGVKESLIKPFSSHEAGSPAPDGSAPARDWADVRFDIVLAPAR